MKQMTLQLLFLYTAVKTFSAQQMSSVGEARYSIANSVRPTSLIWSSSWAPHGLLQVLAHTLS